MQLIVHRGLSDPLCPYAERSRITAIQSTNGHEIDDHLIVSALADIRDQIIFELVGIQNIAVKQIGENNALIPSGAFENWWAHCIEVNNIRYALIGRPSKRLNAGRHEIQAPHIISTTIWRLALKQLKKEKPFSEEYLTAKYPNIASSFDTSRSALDYRATH